MPVYRLHPSIDVMPHPLDADESGVLAVEGDLTPQRLVNAYRHGIFPWFSEYEPMMWWFPDPRCILFPEQLKVSKSMRTVLRNKGFQVTFNDNFPAVIDNCSKISRQGQNGTWLGPEMIDAYKALHRQGYAHSVEVWLDNQLVGGLYGVALGKIFFGESMFSKVSNASKVGLIHLVRALQPFGITCIDCQQETEHLTSLGAVTITASEFYERIRQNLLECLVQEKLPLN